MAKRSAITTKEYLTSAPLPQFNESYTVIEHGFVIDKTLETLLSKGFTVKNELYRCNMNAQIAQGVYHLNYGNDPEMGMMFAWSNSYDKSMRFKCAIGAYVFVCSNGIVSGDMGSWGRKHTGSAAEETQEAILLQIDNADVYYNQLVLDKENMKQIILKPKNSAEIMGRLFLEHKLINVEQLSIVKNELHTPSYKYEGDSDSLWCLYNHITHALKTSHPKSWLDQQRMIHWFLTNEYQISNSIVGLTESITPVPVVTNQLTIEDAIKEAEQGG
jgi:hypothetical protein